MTKQDFEPEKQREYRLYLIWRNLPVPCTNLFDETTDPDLQLLANITTQKQFAQQFNISKNTLTVWNQRPVPDELKELDDWRQWSRPLTKKVMKALYERATTIGSASEVKLWMELLGEYTPNLNITGQLDNTIVIQWAPEIKQEALDIWETTGAGTPVLEGEVIEDD